MFKKFLERHYTDLLNLCHPNMLQIFIHYIKSQQVQITFIIADHPKVIGMAVAAVWRLGHEAIVPAAEQASLIAAAGDTRQSHWTFAPCHTETRR